ncbi:hypothetical protein TPE_1292 [Treponema pedis str. T A4]|uniref:Uncharacterized protein n=1 Tax=Treponema pedis str. T A4 TaxID=1291379 RepID=S5ZMG0_9SPIR|nr:hypothetical protein TPE_1292 [Treponema pedis str. T A4]
MAFFFASLFVLSGDSIFFSFGLCKPRLILVFNFRSTPCRSPYRGNGR